MAFCGWETPVSYLRGGGRTQGSVVTVAEHIPGLYFGVVKRNLILAVSASFIPSEQSPAAVPISQRGQDSISCETVLSFNIVRI